MGLGLTLAGGAWILGAIFLAFFVLVYYPVMRREEDWLRGQFGEVYNQYAAAVPLFLPRGRRTPAAGDEFRWARYRRNREYEAALGLMSGIVFMALKLALK